MNFELYPMQIVSMNPCPGFTPVLALIRFEFMTSQLVLILTSTPCSRGSSTSLKTNLTISLHSHQQPKKHQSQVLSDFKVFSLFLWPAACWPESHIPETSGNLETSRGTGGQGPAGGNGRRADSSDGDLPGTHVPSETIAFITT